MSKAKIQVIDPDGKFRGRLRSAEIPSASWTPSPAADGSQPEVMACDGEPSTGSWLLFTRSASNTEPNECREQTPAQALAWFLDNALHPPEPLVVRARRYWADWLAVRNEPEAMAALTALAQPEANAGDTTCQPPSDDDLATLGRLGLNSGDATSPPCITELVRELGIAQMSNWLDAQVMRVAEWLKQNVGIQLAPSAGASGPTTFSITRRWLKSWDLWRTEAHPFSQPPDVRQVAEDLAAATKAMLPVFRRFGEPVEAAERLILGLEGATPHRTPRMDRAAWSIQHQIIRIGHYISCGALAGDEDLSERRAEWDRQLGEFATEKARRDFKEAFDDDLARPRDDARYVHLLNAARDRRDRERIEIPLDAILAKPVVDHRSRCQRWKDLAEHGLRFYSHNNGRPNRVETIGFGDIVAGNRRYGDGKALPSELIWATEMKAATASLHAIANACGLTATDRLPISQLIQLLDQLLDGGEVDIRAAVNHVEVLVAQAEADEILPQQKPTNVAVVAPQPRRQRVQKNVDDAGHEHLCIAWDGNDPDHRRRPTWQQLAEAVHKALGLTTKVSSTEQALKSRAPRTRAKWDAIGREMAKEKAERVALRRK